MRCSPTAHCRQLALPPCTCAIASGHLGLPAWLHVARRGPARQRRHLEAPRLSGTPHCTCGPLANSRLIPGRGHHRRLGGASHLAAAGEVGGPSRRKAGAYRSRSLALRSGSFRGHHASPCSVRGKRNPRGLASWGGGALRAGGGEPSGLDAVRVWRRSQRRAITHGPVTQEHEEALDRLVSCLWHPWLSRFRRERKTPDRGHSSR